MIDITVPDTNAIQDEIAKAMREFEAEAFVTVGIHESDSGRESGEITNAQLGAIHEFGAEIDHPGGTSYGYATEKDALKGSVRFLKAGKGFMELGTTQPHKITIPARPWLYPGVESGSLEYVQALEKAVKDGKSLQEALEIVGVIAVASVRKYMTDLRTPPNAQGTIRKKGSSNPLIDSGALRGSVDAVVQDTEPTEGL